MQGNIPQSEKWAPGSRERTLETYLRLSTRPGRFDVLLWPETAFPGFLDEDAAARARIADNLPEDAVVLTGAPDRV
ncbi:MAG: apolipoprotein N-acyltransferase, partial [Parvibaculum sp.]